MRNIELKARLRDRDRALEACRQLGASPQGDIRQVDTYYRVREGRLKLRVNEPGETQLVFYRRPDRPEAKGSDYAIQVVPAALSALLSDAMGIVAVVEKVRTLYLWENVRIHLDRVKNLGDFIEFEAVLSGAYDDADGHARLRRLQDVFDLHPGDRISESYVDLMRAAGLSGTSLQSS